MIGWNPRRRVFVSMVVLALIWHPVAHATVYSWKGAGGVLMFSNDPGDVPEDQQATAHQFTAKAAPKPVADPGATPDPPSATAETFGAYERGFDAGLAAGEREVALAAELARSLPAAAASAPIVIEQSPPPMMPGAASYYAPPYYGPAEYYAPYFFPPGFAVSVVPHRHFFPGFRGRPFAPSFAHGRFSRIGMGRMR